jgi:SARP family transcriptional regulator, regulator of embCAB operon
MTTSGQVTELQVLGPLEARIGGEPVSLGGAKQRAVLAVLLLREGEVVSVDRLIEEVWGNDPPPSAAHTLESYVSRLRQLFNGNGPGLVRRGAGYTLELVDAMLDARVFVELHEQAGHAAAEEDHGRVVRLATAALAVWRGPALADVVLASAGRAEAERLEELRLRTQELRFDAQLALGRHEQIVGELQSLVAQSPYRERFVAQLMLALYRSGRHAEALDVYERTRRRLDDDLGLQPSAELQQLSGQIVRQDPELRWVDPGLRPHLAVDAIRSRARRLTELVVVGVAVAAVMAFTASGSTPHPAQAAAAETERPSRVALILPKEELESQLNFHLAKHFRETVAARELTPVVMQVASEPGPREFERLADRLDNGGFSLALVQREDLSRNLASLPKQVRDTTFVFLDSSLDELALAGAANASAVRFGSEQSSELVGYASALTPRRGASGKADTVSVIVGPRTARTRSVARGFERGLNAARKGVRVRVDYVDDVVDPTACERLANDQIDAGSDVVFVDAGRCGLGALAVARIRGVWGIGELTDGVRPGPHILSRTYKDWFKAVTEVMRDAGLGTLRLGADSVLDLNDDYAVGLEFPEATGSGSMWSKVVDHCSKIRSRISTLDS